MALSISSEIHMKYPNGYVEATWKQLQSNFPNLKELVLFVDTERDVDLDELVKVEGEGPAKFGGMVERFGTSLKKFQDKAGLLKSLKLSFMLVAGDETHELLEKEKLMTIQTKQRMAQLAGCRKPMRHLG
jgi:hypothetical protein